jgi:hypothetical protein
MVLVIGTTNRNRKGEGAIMSTRQERSDALEQTLGDLSVPLCELKRIGRADVEKQLNYWKREDDTLKEESVFNRMKELVWDGLQEHIIDITEMEASDKTHYAHNDLEQMNAYAESSAFKDLVRKHEEEEAARKAELLNVSRSLQKRR